MHVSCIYSDLQHHLNLSETFPLSCVIFSVSPSIPFTLSRPLPSPLPIHTQRPIMPPHLLSSPSSQSTTHLVSQVWQAWHIYMACLVGMVYICMASTSMVHAWLPLVLVYYPILYHMLITSCGIVNLDTRIWPSASSSLTYPMKIHPIPIYVLDPWGLRACTGSSSSRSSLAPQH